MKPVQLIFYYLFIIGNSLSWHDINWLTYAEEFGIVMFKKRLREDEP